MSTSVKRAIVLALTIVSGLIAAAPAQAGPIIAYDSIGTPIYDTVNYRAQICGDPSSGFTSAYVRNNLRDLAPRLLVRRGQGWFDVRGYNEAQRGAWWWYGTGHDGYGNSYNGWIFLNHITYRDGTCH
jgi:hypothetical protein